MDSKNSAIFLTVMILGFLAGGYTMYSSAKGRCDTKIAKLRRINTIAADSIIEASGSAILELQRDSLSRAIDVLSKQKSRAVIIYKSVPVIHEPDSVVRGLEALPKIQ